MAEIQLLNVKEVATLLRLSVPSITKRLQARRKGLNNFPLPINQVYAKNYWLRRDIERYVEECSTQANTSKGNLRQNQTSPETMVTFQKFGLRIPQ